MTHWLLQTLIATSALTLLVLVMREPVRSCFGSRITYGLWLIPAARLFMPTLTKTIERSVPAAPSLPPLPFEPSSRVDVAGPAPSLFDQVGGWPTLLFILWLGVATGLFLHRIIAFYRDRNALLNSSSGFARLGSIRIVRSSEILSPVALGILKPIIALPANFERIYAKPERRLVLEHELAHHRSGDLVANLFAFVLLCLQWFNPLAWVAHAAFRFDQEAACDARVLDKAPAADRASYGRAIAKAASGRALLFASALDRPTSLQRRLQSMLRNSSPARRIGGRFLIVTIVAAALPLTASRAIAYIDVPVPAASASPVIRPLPKLASGSPARLAIAAPVPSIRQHPTVAPVMAAAQFQPSGDMAISDDYVTIDGKKKRWEDLNRDEFRKAKAAVARARTALAATHIDEDKLRRDIARVPDKGRIEQIQHKLAESREALAESLERVSKEVADARASGREPDGLELAVRDRLRAVQNINFDAASRALGNIDREKIAADVGRAGESMERAKAELDRIQARIDADPRN